MKRLVLAASAAFLAASVPAVAADLTGKEVFDRHCVHCHGPGDAPATVQLDRTRGKGKGLLTERTDLAPEYIEYIVRHGLKSMPPFVPSDLTEAKLEALVGFLTKKEATGMK